jgi:hypothetical protein
MVYTRGDAKASFNHILDNVLGRGDGTPLKLSLAEEEIEDVFALSNLTDTDIDSLKYKTKDANDNVVINPIRMADRNLLRAFLHFVINAQMEGNPIVGEAWNAITQEAFDSFRINPKYMVKLTSAFSMPAAPEVPRPPPPPPPKPTPTFTPTDMLRRGIKRDPTLFPTLKDEKFNDNWHRSFVNQARAQDVSKVLDPHYIPLDEPTK